MKESWSILHIEDDDFDAELVKSSLENEGVNVSITVIKSAHKVPTTLRDGEYDIIVSDFSLPDGDGFSIVKKLLTTKHTIPIIILSGQIGEENAIRLLHEGATDVIMKEKISRLVPAIRRIIKEHTLNKQNRYLQEELLKHARMLENINTLSPVAMYLFDLKQKKNIFCTRSFEQILGYDIASVQDGGSKFFLDNLHPDDLWVFQDHPKSFSSMSDEDVILAEYRMKDSTGKYHWLRSQDKVFQRDAKGNPEIMLGSMEDITHIKEAEDSQKQSQLLLSQLMQHSDAMVYMIDLEGRFLLINEKMEKLFGMSNEECRGKTREDFIPVSYAELHRKNDLEVIAAKAAKIMEEENQESDGTHYYLSTKFPLYDSSGAVYGIGGISTDITERKRIENALHTLTGDFAALSGEKFFQAVCTYIAKSLHVRTVYVAEITSNNNAKIISDNSGNDSLHGVEYILDNTPCDKVVKKDICIYPRNVADAFPNDQLLKEWGIEAYVGIALFSKSKEKIGLFVLLDTKPITNEQSFINFFHIFSDRVAAELERWKTELELRESEEKYKQLFESESDAIFLIEHKTGKILEANDPAIKMYGYSHTELLCMTNMDLSAEPEETQKRISEYPTARDRFIHIPKRVHKKKDGTKFITEITARVFEWHGMLVHIAAIRDITSRIESEEALEKSEFELRQILETAQDGFWLIDRDGTILRVNDSYCSMSGYNKSEIVGASMTSFEAAESHTSIAEQLETVMQKGHALFEANHRKKNGELWEVEYSLRAFNAENRQFVIFIRDISERKRHEILLKESEERYRSMVELSPDAIFISHDNRFVYSNKAGLELFRLHDLSELVGRSVFEFVDAEYKNIVRSRIDLIDHEHVTVPIIEERLIRSDGSKVIVEVSASHTVYEGKDSVQVVVHDLTRRIEAEQKLRVSEQKHKDIFEYAPVGIYQSDVDGNITTANSKFAEILGYSSAEELRPMNMKDIYVNTEDREMLIEKYLRKRKIFTLEVQWKKKNGSFIWVALTAHAILDADSTFKYFEGFVVDVTAQKMNLNALKESEKNFRTIFESTPDIVAIADLQGTIIEINRTEDGYSKEQIIGKKISEHLTPDDRKKFNTALSSALSTNTTHSVYPVVKDLSGNDLYYHVRITPFQHEEKITNVLISFTNITETKRAEKAFQESELSYRNLFNSMLDAFALHELVLDKNGEPVDYIFVDVNPAFEMLTGLRRADILNKKVTDVIPNTEPYWLKTYARVVRTGIAERFENYSDPLGRWYQGIAYRPKPNHFATLFSDTTERKKDIETLRFRESLENELVNLSKDFVNIDTANMDYVFHKALSNVGKFCHVDRAYLFMVNSEAKTFTNTHEWVESDVEPEILTLQNIPFDVYPGWMSTMMNLEVAHIPDVTQLTDRWKKDKEEFLRQSIQSLVGVPLEISGHLIGFIGFDSVKKRRTWNDDEIRLLRILGDLFAGAIKRITAEKQKTDLEMQVRQIQKLESVGTLASGIAHDFNNILSIIVGHLSIIDKFKDDEKLFHNSIETISKTINRGASIVRQILTFAKKTSVASDVIHVNTMVKEMHKMVKETFPKNIEIRLQLAKALPLIVADTGQFNQALLNLLMNARDAITDAGSITLSTSVVEAAVLERKFKNVAATQYVAISVADTGTGIKEEHLPRIFEPFFTTKDPGKGTGLGLSVIFGVMQSHKGFVDFRSTPNAGTTFTLYFPSDELIGAVQNGAQADVDSDIRGTETILYVEDEDLLMNTTKMFLSFKGFRVITAKDGAEALRIYREEYASIDIVFSDLGLPRMSGDVMFEHMKQIRPDVKAIFATGYLEPSVREKLLSMGAKQIISKPYVMEVVLQELKKVLSSK